MLNNSKKGLSIIGALIIILVAVLTVGIIKDKKDSKANALEYTQSLSKDDIKNESENQSEDSSKKEENTNAQNDKVEEDKDLYSKLKSKSPVKVLILGDGLALSQGSTSPEGHWDSGISYYIENTFGSKAEVTNMAKGGSSSAIGLQDINNKDLSGYDLVITCFGQNDSNSKVDLNTFEANYESIIKKIKTDNPNATILALLPNTLAIDNKYREKISELSDDGVTTVDIKKAFADTKNEATYTTGSLPNNYGYQLYTQTIGKVLSEQAAKNN